MELQPVKRLLGSPIPCFSNDLQLPYGCLATAGRAQAIEMRAGGHLGLQESHRIGGIRLTTAGTGLEWNGGVPGMQQAHASHVFDVDGFGRADGCAGAAADASFGLEMERRVDCAVGAAVDKADRSRANRISANTHAQPA